MASQASVAFEQSRKDILMLCIHAEVVGKGKGRRRRADVLNRAVVVFVSACWESYVEDSAKEAFDQLLRFATTPDVIPAKVRALAADELRASKDERDIWKLAESGWKRVLWDYRDKVLEKRLKNFNTPKSQQVSTLFCELLGLRDVTRNWSWADMSTEQARIKLDEYVIIRGNIAHRTKHDQVVHKNMDKDFMTHVVKLVEKTDDALHDHLRALVTTPNQ
ncbi:MAG TPA: HEPN domain-containing protein [Rubrobacter sp.]|nr:HEPN domain-containing protein [Rubrobacter sp.]